MILEIILHNAIHNLKGSYAKTLNLYTIFCCLLLIMVDVLENILNILLLVLISIEIDKILAESLVQ